MKPLYILLMGVLLCAVSIYQNHLGVSEVTWNCSSLIGAMYISTSLICKAIEKSKNQTK